MIGRIKGVAARFSNVVSHLQCLHCIIHRAVLCSKLSDDLKDIMDTVIVIINFIRSTSSFQLRIFRKLLDDVFAEYQDLLIHCDVRWLSKGKSLDQFCDLKDEILVFLSNCSHKKGTKYSHLVQEDQFMAKVHFLSDIFELLNMLNLQLQGRHKT